MNRENLNKWKELNQMFVFIYLVWITQNDRVRKVILKGGIY